MSNPQKFTLLSSGSASASFTTNISVLNFQLGSLHVLYSGMSSDAGAINIRATNDPAKLEWASLNDTVVSMVSAYGSRMFYITDIGCSDLQVEYKANGVTTGSVSIYGVFKSYV